MKNQPWQELPRWRYLRIVAQRPLQIMGYRMDRARALIEEPVDSGFMREFGGWYHPATAWEREQFRRMGGMLE